MWQQITDKESILYVAISEPGTGFHIAFKMLDDDGNEQVDKKEFLKVSRLRILMMGYNTMSNYCDL